MSELNYGFKKTLPQTSYDEAVVQVTASLKQEGFGVLTEIDVAKTLKAKIDVDFRRYVILGACNPKLAHKALSGDRHIGLLLPCNVVVQEAEGGGTEVSIADPSAMFKLVDDPDVLPVAKDAEERLRRVIDSLK